MPETTTEGRSTAADIAALVGAVASLAYVGVIAVVLLKQAGFDLVGMVRDWWQAWRAKRLADDVLKGLEEP